MILNLSIILGLNLFLIWENPPRLSPDGNFYLNRPFLRPYVLRFPFVWAMRFLPWLWASRVSILLTSIFILWFGGLTASVLWLGLSSTRINTVFPFLTDQAGILFLTLAFLLPPPFNIIIGLLSGLINEKGPLFASLLLWNPLPLLGLIFPLLCFWKGDPPKADDPIWLKSPISEARKTPLSVENLLLPWGFAVVGLLTTPISWVILAYAQLFVAQDRARLYQWIGPMVCITAANFIPTNFILPVLVLHFLNPWRRIV